MSNQHHFQSLFGGSATLALVAALLLTSVETKSADPAADGKGPPVTLESVPGSAVPRITLSARAAERLGIQTVAVSEEVVTKTQTVGGVVVPAMGSHLRPDLSEVWIHVLLSQAEWARLARDKPSRLLPPVVGGRFTSEILAQPSGLDPVVDNNSLMLSLYYTVPPNSGLRSKDRLRVELQLSGSDKQEKVVPNSAVYYDSNGDAWVYVNNEALVFERQPIVIASIIGDLAVLSDGPAVGTPVVTVGAALLYGTEIFGK